MRNIRWVPTEYCGWVLGVFLDRIVELTVYGRSFRLGDGVMLKDPLPGITTCPAHTRGIITKIRQPGGGVSDSALKVWFEGTEYPVWLKPEEVIITTNLS